MRLRIILNGRVQGVCFRAFVQKHASSLGLVGWVKNIDEDKIEMVAEGPSDKLSRLVEYTKKGPLLSRVLDQKVFKEKEMEEFDSFVIKY